MTLLTMISTATATTAAAAALTTVDAVVTMTSGATARTTAHASIAMTSQTGTTFLSDTLVAAFQASVSAMHVTVFICFVANTFV